MENNQRITSSDMLEFGLSLLGCTLTKNKCSLLPRFKAHYGVGSETAAAIWNDLIDKNQGRYNLDASYFLVTLQWFKSYEIDTKLACFVHVCEKTLRKHYLFYAAAIQDLKAKKIVWKWSGNHHHDSTIFIGSVDGTHCRIEEPRNDPSSEWFSHKFNQPGLSYELALDLFESKLIWINGPYPAGNSDLQIFQMAGGLRSHMPDGKKMIADNGYTGDSFLSTPNSFDTEEVAAFKRRAKARMETINARIKEFRIIADRFRHDLSKHKMIFEAVCIIVQYNIERERPIFEV